MTTPVDPSSGNLAPDVSLLREFIDEGNQTAKALYTHLNRSRSWWDKVARGKRWITPAEADRIVKFLHCRPKEDWCRPWSPPMRKRATGTANGANQASTGKLLALTGELVEYVNAMESPVTLYAAVTDGKWLSEFVAGLPSARAKGDTKLLRTQVTKIVVWLVDPDIAKCLIKHNIVDSGLLSAAGKHIDELRTYRRVPDKSDATGKNSSAEVALEVQERYWPGLPPLWAAMAGDLMIAGEWFVNHHGQLTDNRTGELLRREGATAARFQELSEILTKPSARSPEVHTVPGAARHLIGDAAGIT